MSVYVCECEYGFSRSIAITQDWPGSPRIAIFFCSCREECSVSFTLTWNSAEYIDWLTDWLIEGSAGWEHGPGTVHVPPSNSPMAHCHGLGSIQVLCFLIICKALSVTRFSGENQCIRIWNIEPKKEKKEKKHNQDIYVYVYKYLYKLITFTIVKLGRVLESFLLGALYSFSMRGWTSEE